MRVVCDNCKAVYKIPDEKLVKPVNKATCRACGHRMLIPRPPPRDEFADEERTLIKERPVAAPHPDRDRVTSPIEQDEPEATLPRVKATSRPPPRPTPTGPTPRGASTRGRVPSYPEVPLATPAAHRRPAPNAQVFTADDEHTVWVKNKARPSRSRSVTPDEQPTRPAMAPIDTVSPAADRRSGPSAPSRTREERHDPSGDLGLAMAAILVAIVGVFLLSVNIPTGSPWIDLAIGLITSVLALGGLFVAFLMLWTSGRGRRPAARTLSGLAGIVIALLVALVLTSIRGGVAHVSGEEPLWQAPTPPSTAAVLGGELQEPTPAPAPEQPAPETAAAEPVPTEPVTPPTPPTAQEPAPAPAAAPGSETAPEHVVATAPASEPEPARPARIEPAPAPVPDQVTVLAAPKPAPEPAQSEPKSAPQPDLLSSSQEAMLSDNDGVAEASKSEPKASPAPAPKVLDEVPMGALDVMLRNNLAVKKCFFDHMQAEGSLPPRVDVRFTLEASGQVSSLKVTESAFAGTDLEKCLRKAIMAIQFPQTKHSAKITYPFIFQ